MSREAYNELLQLQNFLDDLPPVDHDGKDSWTYIWGQHRYSSSKYYHYHFRIFSLTCLFFGFGNQNVYPELSFSLGFF
jgi:hypothetical protein